MTSASRAAWLAAILFSASSFAQTRTVPPPFAFTHVTVIDVANGRSAPDMTVVVSDRRISAIGRTTTVSIPKDARVVDASGKFLMPGLWDMHIHSLTDFDSNWMYPLLLAHGVTGVRETGTRVEPERVAAIRREILEGTRLGPRYGAATGRILDGPGSVLSNSFVVETPEQGRQRVREAKAYGADFVKVYNMLSREVYLAIVDEAKREKIPVAGHVPLSITAYEASDFGQVSLEHFGDLFLSCSRDEAQLREERRSVLAAGGPVVLAIQPFETKAAASYDAAKARAFCERLKKNGTWVCPTVIISGTLPIERRREADERLKYVPAPTQDYWNTGRGRGAAPSQTDAQMRRARKLEIVRLMHDTGVNLLAGTDAPNPFVYPGFSLHEELAMLVEAGLPPMDVLRMATINPARFLGREKDLGSIDRGKLADLVLLEADPLADIANTRKIHAVVANGRLLDRKALDDLLAGVERANTSAAQPQGARFEITPQTVLMDERFRVTLEGAPPRQDVTIRLEGNSGMQSSASFRSDDRGRVEIPDPMRLVWSAAAGGAPVAGGGAPAGAASRPGVQPLTFTAEVGGRVIATQTIARRAFAENVRVVPVRERGLVGMAYYPPDGQQYPAMIVLPGAQGGIPGPGSFAGGLASRGYVVLALAYFNAEGLPPLLQNIPLEYGATAVEWLKSQPSVDPARIGVLGTSKGGELALLLGATYPSAFRVVVANVPSNVVWPGLSDDSDTPAWTLNGTPVPRMPVRFTSEDLSLSGRERFLKRMQDPAALAQAEIPVERIDSPLLLFSAKDDQAWPSDIFAARVVDRLKAHQFKHPVEHYSYENAGHSITRPFVVTSNVRQVQIHAVSKRPNMFGGTPEGQAHANEDSWEKLLAFLDKYLRK